MGIRTKERAKLLLLRKRVMLDEAPYIIIEKIGGLYHDALSLLLEAVEDNSVHADIKPELAFSLADGYYDIAGSIDAGKTTVMTADLLAWLEPMAQSINQAEAPPVSTPQPAPASEPVTPAAAVLLEQADDAGLSKRERQIRAIEAAAAAQGYGALSIPTKGKTILRAQCQKSNPVLFGAGPDPFDDAWKVAIACDPPRLRMADHRKFTGR